MSEGTANIAEQLGEGNIAQTMLEQIERPPGAVGPEGLEMRCKSILQRVDQRFAVNPSPLTKNGFVQAAFSSSCQIMITG